MQKIRIGDDDGSEVLRACFKMRCVKLHALWRCVEQRAVATCDENAQSLSLGLSLGFLLFVRREGFVGLQQFGRRLGEEVARQQLGFVAGAHERSDVDSSRVGFGFRRGRFCLRSFCGACFALFDRACACKDERGEGACGFSVGDCLFGQLQPREVGNGFDLLCGARVDEHGVARVCDDVWGDGESPSFEQRKFVGGEGDRGVKTGAALRRGAFVEGVEEQQGFAALQHVLVERVQEFFVLDVRVEEEEEVGFLRIKIFGDEERVDVEIGFEGLEGAPHASACLRTVSAERLQRSYERDAGFFFPFQLDERAHHFVFERLFALQQEEGDEKAFLRAVVRLRARDLKSEENLLAALVDGERRQSAFQRFVFRFIKRLGAREREGEASLFFVLAFILAVSRHLFEQGCGSAFVVGVGGNVAHDLRRGVEGEAVVVRKFVQKLFGIGRESRQFLFCPVPLALCEGGRARR